MKRELWQKRDDTERSTLNFKRTSQKYENQTPWLTVAWWWCYLRLVCLDWPLDIQGARGVILHLTVAQPYTSADWTQLSPAAQVDCVGLHYILADTVSKTVLLSCCPPGLDCLLILQPEVLAPAARGPAGGRRHFWHSCQMSFDIYGTGRAKWYRILLSQDSPNVIL